MAGVDAVGEAGELDAVGDEDAFGRVGAEEHCCDGGVEMVAVGDDAEVGALYACIYQGGGDEAGETGVAVVQRRHGVEGVG